ncbi:MAG: histidine kinase [Bacteroidota bacterium]|nr:histidine kinase [Bacteroidota bacterium]MDX5431881.1 histidine kinase [Bacteroidota bacterium]MDX5470595.1 histidine kinase [Bacteroidota bacterium]
MFSHPLIYRNNWIYFLASLLGLGGLLFVLLNHSGLSWQGAISDSLVSTGLLGILLLYLVITLENYLPKKGAPIYLLAGSLIISIAFTSVTEILYPFYYSEMEIAFLSNMLFWPRFLFTFILIGASITSIWFYFRVKSMEAQLARQEESDKAIRDAELYKLRQQLQPHFLFNSLNSINALIGSKPDQARKMVLQLSDFFRGTLRRDENKFIPLEEELEYIRLYLEIEQVRFGHRLQAKVEVDPTLKSIPVPPLVLQPIMENAIKFGLYGTIGEVCICVNAEMDQGFLKIEISNPFDATSVQAEGTGFGLNAVKRRLYLLFARNDLLKTRIENDIFIAQIKFPITHD